MILNWIIDGVEFYNSNLNPPVNEGIIGEYAHIFWYPLSELSPCYSAAIMFVKQQGVSKVVLWAKNQ